MAIVLGAWSVLEAEQAHLHHGGLFGGTHEFVHWLSTRGRGLSYSVGMTIADGIHRPS